MLVKKDYLIYSKSPHYRAVSIFHIHSYIAENCQPRTIWRTTGNLKLDAFFRPRKPNDVEEIMARKEFTINRERLMEAGWSRKQRHPTKWPIWFSRWWVRFSGTFRQSPLILPDGGIRQLCQSVPLKDGNRTELKIPPFFWAPDNVGLRLRFALRSMPYSWLPLIWPPWRFDRCSTWRHTVFSRPLARARARRS